MPISSQDQDQDQFAATAAFGPGGYLSRDIIVQPIGTTMVRGSPQPRSSTGGRDRPKAKQTKSHKHSHVVLRASRVIEVKEELEANTAGQ
mmetsp:Transcript_38563/g.93275  ORF Transcript_38563/g.93275 Transcript_38563/m.93275 type:complete len:90 (-) Transcript_38563:316-585(-)